MISTFTCHDFKLLSVVDLNRANLLEADKYGDLFCILKGSFSRITTPASMYVTRLLIFLIFLTILKAYLFAI